MGILLSDFKCYAAAVVAENEVTTNIGGAPDRTKKFDFSDFAGSWQVKSDNVADDYPTGRHITLFYRDNTGAILSESVDLDGTTFALGISSIERIEKAIKSGSFSGNACLVAQAVVTSNTLPAQVGVAADQIKFPAGASAISGTYTGMVFLWTGGTGTNKFVEIIDYDGPNRIATVNKTVTGFFDNTTTYDIRKGVFFDKTPNEISYVVRMDYNSAADFDGGSNRDFYVKGFFEHTDASGSGLNALNCVVREAADPQDLNTFAIGTAQNDTVDNGAFNRQTAPSSGVTTFDNADKNVPSTDIVPGNRIAFWKKLHRVAGATSVKDYWTPQMRFQTT